MRKTFQAFIFCLIIFAQVSAQKKITVAVSANMQYTVEAIRAEFNKTDKTEIELVPGASGNLTQQIMQGAPFDIFLSADTAYPMRLYEKQFCQQAPKVYAQGLLVLWSTKKNVHPGSDLTLLLNNEIQHIAIPNPKIAPYGAAAVFILKKYNLYSKIYPKLVTGESIAQTSQFIATQTADIGFTAKSVVLSDKMKDKGSWFELNPADYPPILQAVVLLKHAQQSNSVSASKFYGFLFSEQAKIIFKKFGYIVQ
jgi:molybdate transport system substrate-binding protein